MRVAAFAVGVEGVSLVVDGCGGDGADLPHADGFGELVHAVTAGGGLGGDHVGGCCDGVAGCADLPVSVAALGLGVGDGAADVRVSGC